MIERRTLAALLALAGLAACATTGGRYALTGVDQEKLKRQYVGQDFALASSLYVSDFFGETDRYFVDARPFDIVELYHHDGSKIAAGATIGEIIPAGTPVRVSDIQYPVDPLKAKFDTPISQLLPTAHVWIVLQRTDPGALKVPLVMVLPRDIPSVEAFNREIQERLKSDQWVSQWLTVRPPLTLAGILRKEPAVGMSWADLVATLGTPRNAAEKEKAELLEFVADYGDLQITVQSNSVTLVTSRKAEATAKQQDALARAEAARLEAADKARASENDKARAALEKRIQAETAAKKPGAVEAPRPAEAVKAEPRKIGAAVEPVDPQLASALGLKSDAYAFVTSVKPGSEAAVAGLQPNDIILSVNKIGITGPPQFVALVASAAPKQLLELEVLRRGSRSTVSMGTDFGPPLVAAEPTSRTSTTTATASASAPAGSSGPTVKVAVEVNEPPPPLGETPPAPPLPWWQDAWHFGIELAYAYSTTGMASAKTYSKELFDASKQNQRDNATLFGAAHNAELLFVVSSPWIARVKVGAAGLYDFGSIGVQSQGFKGTYTGHAWAATIPILVGGRLPFMDRRLAATVDVGVEFAVAAGLSYGGTGIFPDSPAFKAPGLPIGWLARGGLTWHIIPQLAVMAELSGRGLSTDQLVLRKHPDQTVSSPSGKPLSLDFGGIGGRVGFTGYFF